jgi:hypothetical protein
MKAARTTCVFVGSRKDSARAYSRLIAQGIKAEVIEEPGSTIPYMMGGPCIASVYVAVGDEDRAKTVLMDVGFK